MKLDSADGNASRESPQEGLIRNGHRNLVGSVSVNGFVYDVERTLLGYVNEQGMIRCIQLRCIGSVGAQGRVYDLQQTLLGSVDQEGVIYNAQHHKIGSVEYLVGTFPFRAEVAAFFLIRMLEEG